jgi:hypothetical protein
MSHAVNSVWLISFSGLVVCNLMVCFPRSLSKAKLSLGFL